MFYKELYIELGRLFYSLAGIDGKVSSHEKAALQRFINEKWKPLEHSEDRFGTDRAYLIDYAFDFEESALTDKDYFSGFKKFYKQNKSSFSPEIISNILQTSKAIARAYRGVNKKESEVLLKLIRLFAE